MTDRDAALAACDGTLKDHYTKVAGIFIDEFAMAEGSPNAAQLRQDSAGRFKTILLVYKAAHDAAVAAVGQAFPG